ncbi:MAG: hypothetical protein IJ814_07650 [Paludibacteraceae bacterium]|nr:hypothetical protein [Paludibacteraceae bacterium]
MKKLLVLALGAILAANISAQEAKVQKAEGKKVQKERKMSKDECKKLREASIEHDIKHLSKELYLSDEQTEKFAKTYREFKAEQMKLAEKYQKQFVKDGLNERQAETAIRYHGPKHKRGDAPQAKRGDTRKGDFRRGDAPQSRRGDFRN